MVQQRRQTGDHIVVSKVLTNLGTTPIRGHDKHHKNIADVNLEVGLHASHTPTFIEASEMKMSKESSYNVRKSSRLHLSMEQLKRKSGFAFK